MKKLLELLYKGAKWVFKKEPKKLPKKPKSAKKRADKKGKPAKGKKTACANCKKPNRRHNPCKTKGKDFTKDKNSMIDPDYADVVNSEIDDIIAGNIEKIGDKWITPSGRSYGLHDKALHPTGGPGIKNIDRAQHKLIKELNNKGFDGAQKMKKAFKEKGLLSDDKIKEVEDLWKKCKK